MSGVKQALRGLIGVADLKIQNDVAGELKLRPAAIKTLEYLIEKGGEVNWSWEGIKQETREMVADLIEAGLCVEREHVTHAWQVKPDRLTLKITEKGRNVIDVHHKRKIVPGAVKELG